MLYAELIYHAVGEHKGGWQLTDLFKPTFFLAVRYLPFSLPFFFALWRVFHHPAVDARERRFERFLTCWILFGLLIFSLAKHQRADHLLPLWPACALLAGREMAFFAERIGKTRFAGIGVVISIILIGSTYAAVNSTSGKHEGSSDYSREMALATDAERAAKAFIASGLDARQLNHIDTPITVQLYLGTYRPFINRTQLDELLAKANAPVDVALGKTSIEELAIIERYPDTKRIFRWPENESEKPVMQVYRIAPR
jgi:4-amino-4-deoxy-L-arabinose transferase-like glycosyltransferase